MKGRGTYAPLEEEMAVASGKHSGTESILRDSQKKRVSTISRSATRNADGTWPSLHFATPVWGEEYVRVFLDTILPTLFSPGNLPAVPDRKYCVYRVFTLAAHFAQIKQHSSYAALANLVDVELIDTAAVFAASRTRKADSTKYDLMTAAYNEARLRSDAANAAAVFLNADMIFSDGSMANMVRIFREGKRAIEIEGFRTNKDGMEVALHLHFKDESGAISIASRALVELSLTNIHRISRKHYWNRAGNDPFIPFHTYWPVGSNGLISRATHLYPLLVYPDRKFANTSQTIDWDLLDHALSDVSTIHVIEDSDLIYSCELSDRDYDIQAFFPARQRFALMCQWVRENKQCSPRHRSTLRTPILIHSDDGNGWRWWWAKWRTQRWVNAVLGQGSRLNIYTVAEYWQQFRRYGWRALPAIALYALLLPLVGRQRALPIAKNIRHARPTRSLTPAPRLQLRLFGWRALLAVMIFRLLSPILGRHRAGQVAVALRGNWLPRS
jgi:hypothetical protein